MPKKSKDEFKAAFKVIKKPARPTGFSSKEKAVLETAMDKKGVGNDEFKRLAAELYSREPDYVVDLVAYKFVKHFDDTGDKRPAWVGLVPPEAFEKALKKVVPGDTSDRLTQVTLEKAVVRGGNEKITSSLIYERDPEGTTHFALTKWTDASDKGDKAVSTKWVEFFSSGANRQAPDPAAVERNKKLVEAILESDNKKAAATFAERMSEFVIIQDSDLEQGGRGIVMGEVKPFPLDHAAVLQAAKKNPKLFAAEILPNMRGKNEFSEIVTDPAIRTLMIDKAPKEWASLVATSPVLAVLDNVDKTVKSKGLTKQTEIVGAMFDAIVGNDGIPLAYYTNNFTPNSVILSGGSPKDLSIIEDQKKMLGAEAPDVPCTQCHQLLHLTTMLMQSSPNMPKKPKIVQDTCTNMLMTKSLDKLPGKGLLDRSFSGNVYDDGDTPTRKILFSGNVGKDSHTWLVIDGVPFDPVLGTRGDEVAASIEERFDWLIDDRVARGSNGNYIIKGRGRDDKPEPKPDANKMGFMSAYRLTKTPEKYLDDEQLAEIGLKAAPAAKKADEPALAK